MLRRPYFDAEDGHEEVGNTKKSSIWEHEIRAAWLNRIRVVERVKSDNCRIRVWIGSIDGFGLSAIWGISASAITRQLRLSMTSELRPFGDQPRTWLNESSLLPVWQPCECRNAYMFAHLGSVCIKRDFKQRRQGNLSKNIDLLSIESPICDQATDVTSDCLEHSR